MLGCGLRSYAVYEDPGQVEGKLNWVYRGNIVKCLRANHVELKVTLDSKSDCAQRIRYAVMVTSSLSRPDKRHGEKSGENKS